MVATVDASASLYTPSNGLPAELHVLVDFVAGDDRPTLILDDATAEIVYRNSAFDAFAATLSHISWLESLLGAARIGTRPERRTTQQLGSFAEQPWSRKSIASSWTAVTCPTQTHRSYHVKIQPDQARALSPENQDSAQALPSTTIPLKRQESDSASMTSTSTYTSSIGASDMDTPFEDLTVDWLLFPKPSPDPWLDFVLNHNWEDKTVGPIHSWPTMLRQMYTTILASREPRVLYWGNEMLLLYNKEAKFVVGELHPSHLASRFYQSLAKTSILRLSR
ncbi:unnamed protein product [Aureobasidium vineae]|uniref:Uncharacterized protein n=1 Tax=Aureobasidium vineae TaxID=2773715 RepID=A0A9N8JG04_9PEZI|nr:unnamed protein product [Aureobasidium vineae]